MGATSTPLRKSKKNRHTDAPGITPINTAHEDEVERRNRRSMVDMQKRLSTPSQGSPNLNSSRNVAVDVEVVMEHYKLCQKLFAENKINSKNVWNLKLIDYLKILISQDMFGKDTMLVAATSLDICVKVFACRVDDLYEKGLQLANTMASLERQQVIEREENDVDEAEHLEGEKRQKKKKKMRRLSASQKHTIAKDPKTLELSNAAKVPTTFFAGHINMEASNNENLFTNKLPLDHVGYKIMLLDNVNRGMPFYDEEDPSIQQNQVTSLKVPVGAFKICPAFTGFYIDEWNPDQEENQIAELNKTVPQMNDELIYDEQGIPVAELDGSIHDIFADDHANDIDMLDEEHEELNRVAVANQEVEFISSFCPTDNACLINRSVDPWWMKRIWVGPSHWKHKFIKQRVSRFSGKVTKQVQTRMKKKVQHTSEDIDFDNYTPLDMTKEYKLTRKIKCDVAKCTWPTNYLTLTPDYRLLTTKPFIPQEEHQAKPKDDEYEHSPYDYNNPNDSQYCSQHNLQDNSDNNNEPLPETDDILEEEHVSGERADNITKDLLANLVEAPDMVQQTYIPYALRAKKMNMKKLKSTVWEILTEDTNSKRMINIEEKPVKEMNLSELYNNLPTKLPQSMSTELSPHLAFIALLHLTNEHNLSLSGQKDLSDLKIKQDKQEQGKQKNI